VIFHREKCLREATRVLHPDCGKTSLLRNRVEAILLPNAGPADRVHVFPHFLTPTG